MIVNQAHNEWTDDKTLKPLAASSAAALEFLLGSRNAEGWWEDFPMYVGAGDEYVTAYVGTLVGQVADERAQEATHRAWSLLLSRRTNSDGWGWNRTLMMDADSTAWGLRLAHLVGGQESDHAHGARLYLRRHLQPDGGIAAYDELDFFPNPDAPRNGLSYVGWFQSHACVTAGAAVIDGLQERTREFLHAAQHEDGSWKSYWWCDHEFVTALAAQELANETAAESECIDSAVKWSLNRLGARGCVTYAERPGGAVFPTACCLRLLLLAGDVSVVRTTIDRTLGWLLSNQRADGSWSPSARTRIPRTDVFDPDEDTKGTVVALDMNRNFTTATVLEALRLTRERLESPETYEYND